MNQRDYSYYEAHGADVKLDEITSDEYNKQILHRLRDQDLKSIYVCERIDGFDIMEGDDLGWLAYFIGRSESLRELTIDGLYKDEDEGREHRMVHALSGAIARSRSIQQVSVDILSNDGFATIARSLVNLTQLERFYYRSINSNDRINDCVMIGSLLESGINLKKLSLPFCNIGYAGVAALANGLTSIGSSLKVLDLSHNDIDSEALSTLVAALAHCTCLEILDISGNDFSMAAAELRSLSDWLQIAALTLDDFGLRWCSVSDEGMQALIEGAMDNYKGINLQYNHNITASGWRCLSTSLQSERCHLEKLVLSYMDIEDDGAKVLARGLVGNKVLKCVHLCFDDEDHISITPAGWSAFSNVLCDTSTVNNTYLSNHTLQVLWDYTFIPYWDIEYKSSRRARVQYLKLNKAHPQHAAKCKILMHHSHLDMAPLLQWELKCLPLAIGWFERAKPCTSLPISYRCESSLLEESDEEFESRILTAMYQFVRGAPKKVLERRDELILVAAYDDKIAVVEEENKRLQKELEQRDRKIAQLEKRLREIAQAARNALEGEE
mmetsp:Transcript_3414/g.5635  ORF Transcript_3414/g.5635 Transcript_3414/m.5635 type:complete len:553 (-) Transcript_3414:71-1729(-)